MIKVLMLKLSGKAGHQQKQPTRLIKKMTKRTLKIPTIRSLRRPNGLLSRLPLLAVITALIAGLLMPSFVQAVSSQDLQNQINSLNSQNSQAQQALTGLQSQASSYQDAINKLQAQINVLQQAISANQSKQADLQAQIDAAQAQLDQQKKLLGDDIRQMYLDGQTTTLEMLASSKNLSDFVDKQQYRNSVQDKITSTLHTITDLKHQLSDKKTQVDALLATQQSQQNQLNSSQNEQSSLLSYNQGQQGDYNQQIKNNQSALASLYAQQAALIQASFGGTIHYGGTGGYPYNAAVCLNSSGDCSGNAGGGAYNWGMNGYPYDPAGWQYRNCTSYAFWRLTQTTGISLTAGSFPNVLSSGGRIGYSLPDFRNLGFRVDHDPSGGAVLAVNTGGNWGHIMYVEAASGGTAYVSQYNAAGDGLYSTGSISASNSSIWFVHVR
ncbi:MAG: CHAP domain-containing protein [Candidatus Saccharimonadales bacterium]